MTFDLFNFANQENTVKIGNTVFENGKSKNEAPPTSTEPNVSKSVIEEPAVASVVELTKEISEPITTDLAVDPITIEQNSLSTDKNVVDSLIDAVDAANVIFEEIQSQLIIPTQKAKKSNPAVKVDKANSDVKANDFSDINEDTTIRIGFESFPITDYFQTEEIENSEIYYTDTKGILGTRKITSEDLRIRMEKAGFVTLVKGFVTLEYFGGERNFVMVIPQAKKKGAATIEVINEVSSSNDELPSFFVNKYGKLIPFKLLEQFYCIAKLLGKLKLEVLGEIYFNFDTGEFSLYIPRQSVHEFWCEPKEEGTYQRHMMMKGQHVELACAIHSHHYMHTFPSATDNASERIPYMAYVIIGDFNLPKPTVYARTFTGTEHIQIKPTKFFEDGTFSEKDEYTNLPFFKADWVEIKMNERGN